MLQIRTYAAHRQNLTAKSPPAGGGSGDFVPVRTEDAKNAPRNQIKSVSPEMRGPMAEGGVWKGSYSGDDQRRGPGLSPP